MSSFAAPANGRAVCKMQRGIYICEFSCDEGYYPDGPLAAACLLNTGQWSDPAPKCLRMSGNAY
jgi:hypothetical protein